MRKSCLLILFVIPVVILQAMHVPVEQASLVAGNFYIKQAGFTSSQNFSVDLIDVYQAGNDTLFYAFSVNQGFVLVAADNRLRPVLGFSIDGTYDDGEIPPALSALFDNHAGFLNALKTAGLEQDPSVSQEWNQLLNSSNGNPNAKLVSSLISSSWDEVCGYNTLFPDDSNGACGKTYTGSIAVAMGQVMKFYSFPKRGSDSISYLSNYGVKSLDFEAQTYDWNAMPDVVNAGNTEIPKILYHSALSVEANFSTTLFNINCYNINVNDIRKGLMDHFGYSPSMQGLFGYQYSDSAWKHTLMAELDFGRPIIFSGQPQQSCNRVFLIDGYDSQDYFHMNFGFGGLFNGYYLIDQINIATINYNFNTNQQALIGIVPVHKKISGFFYYGYTLNKYIDNSMVLLTRMNGQVLDTAVVQTNGSYEFAGVADGDFTLEVIAFPAWGGANATDAFLALRAFVGLISLTGLKYDAADVDGTGYINSSDALQIGRRFVGMIPHFPTSDWIKEDYSVVIDGANVVINMKALCRGDIDSSYSP